MAMQLPHVDTALVAYLDKLFPDRSPDEDDTQRRVWMDVGAIKVVKHLKYLLSRQQTL